MDGLFNWINFLDGKFGEKWYVGNYTRGNAPYDSIITSAARRLIAPIFIGKYRMDQHKKLLKEHHTGKDAVFSTISFLQFSTSFIYN